MATPDLHNHLRIFLFSFYFTGLTDVCLLESGRVVDTVARDGHDATHPLEAFDDHQLLLRRRAGEHHFRVHPFIYSKRKMSGWMFQVFSNDSFLLQLE